VVRRRRQLGAAEEMRKVGSMEKEMVLNRSRKVGSMEKENKAVARDLP
jgi:hypothetical protein